MKNFCVSLAVAIMLVLPSTAISQQAGSLTKLHDDFSGKWLDPEKWLPWHINCWGALECVREIWSNKLHLAVRNVGAADSDQFITWSESQVYFPEPNAVTGIRADITVESFSGIGCSTNETDRTQPKS